MDNGNNTMNAAELLREAHDHSFGDMIPAIVLTVLVALIGIVPNFVTVVFYGYKTKTKSSTTTFITALAVTDLAISMFVFAYLDELINIYYTKELTCKVTYFLAHWLVMVSVGILWLISIDRYRRICSVVGWQFNITSTKITVLVLICITMVASMRDFWTYDAVELNITMATRNASVIGHHCTNTNDPDLQTLITVFSDEDKSSIIKHYHQRGFTTYRI